MPWMIPAAIGGSAVLGALGSYFGGRSAADAQREAGQAQLQGMRESISAQERMYGQQRQDLAPFRQFGLDTMGQYRNLLGNPDLDSIRQERMEATDSLNAQLAGMGMHNSGFAGRQHARLQGDYASRMYQARLQGYAPLLGMGGQAAGQMSNAAGQLGQGIGGALQSGYGSYGQHQAQAGMLEGMGTSGALGTLGNAGLAGGLYGMSGGGSGGYGGYPNYGQGYWGSLGGGGGPQASGPAALGAGAQVMRL